MYENDVCHVGIFVASSRGHITGHDQSSESSTTNFMLKDLCKHYGIAVPIKQFMPDDNVLKSSSTDPHHDPFAKANSKQSSHHGHCLLA